jgi:hypothetical protein
MAWCFWVVQVVFHTEIGQLLDLTSQPLDGEVDLDRFTVERYVFQTTTMCFLPRNC